VPGAPAASYDLAMTIAGNLERARRLIFAAEEIAAKELLLTLGEQIEKADRDDLMLEVYAQLGEIYLVRTAYNGVEECLRRITDCLAIYQAIRAGTNPKAAAHMTMSDTEVDHMIRRYSRRAQFLRTGLAAAAHGDHEAAEAALLVLTENTSPRFADLEQEYGFLVTYARIFCALALCDDDLHVRSIPLWEQVIDAIDGTATGSEFDDFLLVQGGTGYGRFCVETGRLAEAEPWLQRAGARAQKRGWKLAAARTQLERATAAWASGDRAQCQTLVHEAYPAIAESYRAHDVSRSWLYLGLLALSIGELNDADERFGHAERHWREVEKPLHIRRILLQRSWIDTFRGDFAAARERASQARELLDSWPRRSWLQYARLDDHVGSILRAEAMAGPDNAKAKLEQAAELKVPAVLAVDSVRHSMTDADARMRWATHVSARILAGAFALAWEWGNTELVSELIEYHSVRGSFSTQPQAHSAIGPRPVVRVALSGYGLAAGIAVRLRSGVIGGEGVLDADRVATFPLADGQQQPVTESTAWDHDWRSTVVTVGAEVEERPETRERIRDFARARLRAPAADAFLAEVLAAESDY
jgi:tetratricopeptide (TPR) repeat protein